MHARLLGEERIDTPTAVHPDCDPHVIQFCVEIDYVSGSHKGNPGNPDYHGSRWQCCAISAQHVARPRGNMAEVQICRFCRNENRQHTFSQSNQASWSKPFVRLPIYGALVSSRHQASVRSATGREGLWT